MIGIFLVGIPSIYSSPHYDQNLHEGKVETQLAVGLLRDGRLLIVANVLPRRGGHPYPLSTLTFPLSWLVMPPSPLVKTQCNVPAREHSQNGRFRIRLQTALQMTASTPCLNQHSPAMMICNVCPTVDQWVQWNFALGHHPVVEGVELWRGGGTPGHRRKGRSVFDRDFDCERIGLLERSG